MANAGTVSRVALGRTSHRAVMYSDSFERKTTDAAAPLLSNAAKGIQANACGG